MRCFTVDLKDEYPFLKKESTKAILSCYILDNSPELESDRKHPALLVFPGGGYEYVSFREAEPMILPFMGKGFCAFVLDYSVRPAKFPTQLREAAAAIHYLRSHAEEFHLFPDKIAAFGGSAGGNLTATLATMWNEPFLAEELHCDSHMLRPDLQILNYPVITAEKGISHEGSFRVLAGHGGELSEDEVHFFSLENHVTADTPKAFFWHTAADGCVPVESSLRYAAALSAHKVPYELHIYPYGGHGLSVSNYTTAPNMNQDFIVPYIAGWVDHALAWLAMEFKLQY